MTYEELQDAVDKKQQEIDAAYQEKHKLEWQYIQERLPFPFRKYQRIKMVTEVTEESRQLMTDEWKAKRKNQVGVRNEYRGMLTGYIIGKHGDIRPCFWGGKPTYPMGDKIISIEVDEVQSPFSCMQCARCRDYHCYMTDSTRPSFPVDENSFVCGYFSFGETHE